MATVEKAEFSLVMVPWTRKPYRCLWFHTISQRRSSKASLGPWTQHWFSVVLLWLLRLGMHPHTWASPSIFVRVSFIWHLFLFLWFLEYIGYFGFFWYFDFDESTNEKNCSIWWLISVFQFSFSIILKKNNKAWNFLLLSITSRENLKSSEAVKKAWTKKKSQSVKKKKRGQIVHISECFIQWGATFTVNRNWQL